MQVQSNMDERHRINSPISEDQYVSTCTTLIDSITLYEQNPAFKSLISRV